MCGGGISMIRLPRLLQAYRDAGAFHTLLNLSGFIDDEAFVTKSGDIGVVLRVQGVDDDLEGLFAELLRHLGAARVQETGRSRRGGILPLGGENGVIEPVDRISHGRRIACIG